MAIMRWSCSRGCCVRDNRTAAKREWRLQLADDIWDARSEGICTYDYCTEKDGE